MCCRCIKNCCSCFWFYLCCCCLCRKRNKGDAASGKKGKKGAPDLAADRIQEKLLSAFDQTFSVEEAIRAVLQKELFAAYEPVFISNALAERVAAAFGKDVKKGKKKVVEVTKMPTEPTDSKESSKKAQALWDKYEADKRAYELWALGKARRADLTEGAVVEYPEDLQYLRPMSEKTGKPLKVVITKVPKDPKKALWSDEIKPVMWQAVDLKARKDKKVMKQLQGKKSLSDRCYEACKDDILTKLIALSKSDAAIWEGVKPIAKKKPAKKGEPKEPKEPKDLIDPAKMFTEGKNADKYEAYDDDGVPTSKKTKKEPVDLKAGEIKPLKAQWDKAKVVWDKHQEALKTYQEEMKRLRDLESGEGGDDDFGIPMEQKQESCKTAGQNVTEKLVQDLLVKRGEELAAEVNKGFHDPAELKDIVVQEAPEEEEVITDPVLKAFRRFDQEATNACSADDLKGFFSALGEDELEQGTHKFYSEVSEAELDFTRGKLGDAGVEQGGSMAYAELKNFIEAADVPALPGKPPTNLVSCLLDLTIESRLSGLNTMEVMFSPRTWRSKLGEEFGSPGGASPRASPRGGKKSPRDKKDRPSARGNTEDKDEEGKSSPKTSPKSERNSKRQSTKKVDGDKKDRKSVKKK